MAAASASRTGLSADDHAGVGGADLLDGAEQREVEADHADGGDEREHAQLADGGEAEPALQQRREDQRAAGVADQLARRRTGRRRAPR